MQVLTIVVQAVLVGWLVFVLALSVGMARRTLEARRRRRGYWEELCRFDSDPAGEEGTLTYGADALRPIEGDDRD